MTVDGRDQPRATGGDNFDDIPAGVDVPPPPPKRKGGGKIRLEDAAPKSVGPVGLPALPATTSTLSPVQIRRGADKWFTLHVEDLSQSSQKLHETKPDGLKETTDSLKQLKLREEVREKQIASGLALFGRGSVAKTKPNITVDVTVYEADGSFRRDDVIDVPSEEQ